MLSNQHKKILLAFVLVVALLMRLYHFNTWSLTNDELSVLLGLSYGSLTNNIVDYVSSDFHPAGIQVLVWFWCKLFGTSVFALRLPFVLMGTASVYLAFIASRRWFNFSAAILVAATLAVSQFAILYSQIARPYSAGMFFILVMLIGWNGFVYLKPNSKPSFSSKTIFVLGMVLSMYNHYFSFLLAGIIGLSGIFIVDKKNRNSYLLCGVLAVVLFLPHLKITIGHFSAGGLGWLAKPDYSYFSQFAKYQFNQSKYYLIFILVVAFITAIKIPFRLPINKMRWFALIWFLLPLLIAFYYSLYVSPVLQHSILLFSYPFLLFFIFSFTPINQKLVLYAVPLILTVGVIQIHFINKFNGSNEFARFKEIAEHIKQADDKFGAPQITHAINIVHPLYINYYLDKMEHPVDFIFYSNPGKDSLQQLISQVERSNTPYFMYCWTNADCPPEINEIIQEKYPYLIEKQLYFNSEYYLYSKQAADNGKNLDLLVHSFCTNFDTIAPNFSAIPWLSSDSTISFIGNYQLLDNAVEYSSTFSIPINKLITQTSDIVHFSVMVNCIDEVDKDALMVCSINNGSENYFWFGTNLSNFVNQASTWTKCYQSIRLPELRAADDVISFYIYNPKKHRILIDDMCIRAKAGNPVLYGLRKDRFILFQ